MPRKPTPSKAQKPSVRRTPAIPISYAKPPKQGAIIGHTERPHTLVQIRPITNKNGKASAVLTWMSNCEICDVPFIFTSGLKTSGLSKRCDEHRVTRKNGKKKSSSSYAVRTIFEEEECCHESGEPCSSGRCECNCSCECIFDTDSVEEIDEYQGNGQVYGLAYCETHRKYCAGSFPGYLKRNGSYQENWSKDCY